MQAELEDGFYRRAGLLIIDTVISSSETHPWPVNVHRYIKRFFLKGPFSNLPIHLMTHASLKTHTKKKFDPIWVNGDIIVAHFVELLSRRHYTNESLSPAASRAYKLKVCLYEVDLSGPWVFLGLHHTDRWPVIWSFFFNHVVTFYVTLYGPCTSYVAICFAHWPLNSYQLPWVLIREACEANSFVHNGFSLRIANTLHHNA